MVFGSADMILVANLLLFLEYRSEQELQRRKRIT
jgi:hypothetical protein